MKKDKLYITLIIALLGIFTLSLVLQNSALNDLKWFALFAAAILGFYRLLKQNKFSNKLKQYSNKNQNQSGEIHGVKECEQMAKDWAKDSYDHLTQGQELSFAWNRAKTDKAPLYDFSSEEFTTVRYFYTNYGPKDKPTYIYVDATNGGVISSKPAEDVNSDKPFDALEGYKLTKKALPRLISAQAQKDDKGVIEDFNFEIGGSSKQESQE
jgi:hypothetical protein